jgi:hypothetical protein
MHAEQYNPGELVISMDQRSFLNEEYKHFYEDNYSAFREIINYRK